MHCFDNDEEDLEYLTSLMGGDDDDDDAREDVSLRSSEKPKSRQESGVFDEELDAVAKNRKRRFSQEAKGDKKRLKEQQENDKRTASLEGGY